MTERGFGVSVSSADNVSWVVSHGVVIQHSNAASITEYHRIDWRNTPFHFHQIATSLLCG